MKKNIVFVILLFVFTSIFACARNDEKVIHNEQIQINDLKENKVNKEADMEKIILEHFTEYTKIPRPSKHEEKISEYVYNWAIEHNFKATRDNVNNVIVDVPATEGMEDVPIVALQTHIDMVFAQKEGLNLDPLTTKINMVIDGDKITSDGNTSLGADDGIGDAISMCAAEGYMTHGPLRLIFTTDEEVNQTGVRQIDKNVVKDIKYMINLDSETSTNVCVSSAAGVIVEIGNEYNIDKPINKKAYSVKIANCLGGHSGDDIHLGRANAIIVLAKILENTNLDFEIVSIKGGDANNAIPSSAEAIIVFDENSDVVNKINEEYNKIRKEYENIEPNMELLVNEKEVDENVISISDSKNIISFLTNVKNGVYTWSKDIENLPECSSNVGIINCKDGKLQINIFARSSDKNVMNEMLESHSANINKCSLKLISQNESTKAWKFNPNSELLKICQETYKELNGKEIVVEATHAGLECGAFAEYNSDLDIISIGPDIVSPHSIKETLYKPSIMSSWKLLEKILNKIK